MSEIQDLETKILEDVQSAADEQALEALRVSVLGKKGSISEKMKTLGKMTPEERQVMGPALNGLKNTIGDAIAERRQALREITGKLLRTG